MNALCSPTRAAPLSGRNDHEIGFGTVVELAAGFPGYNSIWPKSAASIAEVLKLNGYTQGRERVSQGLGGVREAARRDKKQKFTALLHQVTVGLLRDSYQALKRPAAPGVDGVTWQQYGEGLEEQVPASAVTG